MPLVCIMFAAYYVIASNCTAVLPTLPAPKVQAKSVLRCVGGDRSVFLSRDVDQLTASITGAIHSPFDVINTVIAVTNFFFSDH